MIQRESINENNFIRFNSIEYAYPNPINIYDLAGENKRVYKNTLANKSKFFKPYLCQNENFAFYCNAAPLLQDGDFVFWQLDLIKSIEILPSKSFNFDVVQSNLATLQKDSINTFEFNFYIDEIQFPSVANGDYQLLIWNTSTNQTKYISNVIRIDSNCIDYTTILKYRNSTNQFNYNYEDLPNFYNYIRIPFLLNDLNYENEITQYRSVSTGKLRNLKSQNDKILTLIGYKFDEYAHDAMINVINSNELYINNEKFNPRGNWEIQNESLSYLSNGIGDFFNERFSVLQKDCNIQVVEKPFKFTIDTTIVSATASNQFQLALSNFGSYDFLTDWGDSTANRITTFDQAETLHTYTTTGVKNITIAGLFRGILFNGGGDRNKILTVEEWGDSQFISTGDAFNGCENLTLETVSDIMPTVSSMEEHFRGTTSLRLINRFNEANWGLVTDVSGMFFQSGVTEPEIGNIDVSSFTIMDNFLRTAPNFNSPLNWGATFQNVTSAARLLAFSGSFNQDLSGLVIASLTDATDMIRGTAISDANYSLILDITTGWPSQPIIKNNVPFGALGIKYNASEVTTGTTDGATTAFKLIDSTQNFVTTVTVGDVVYNTITGAYARVTAIDSNTQLTIDLDIMTTGQSYSIQSSNAAKGLAKLILDFNWLITNNGYNA